MPLHEPSQDNRNPENTESETIANPTGTTSRRAFWTAGDDAIMVDVLLQARANGDQSGNGFKPHVWHQVLDALKRDSTNKAGALKTAEKCADHWSNVSMF